MTAQIESAIQRLISKVENSQSIIDNLAKESEDLKELLNERDDELEDLRAQLAQAVSLVEASEKKLSVMSADLITTQADRDVALSEAHGLQRKIQQYILDEQESQKSFEVIKHQRELALVELRQVQKDLEHYYVLSQKQSQLLAESSKAQERFVGLLANFNAILE